MVILSDLDMAVLVVPVVRVVLVDPANLVVLLLLVLEGREVPACLDVPENLAVLVDLVAHRFLVVLDILLVLVGLVVLVALVNRHYLVDLEDLDVQVEEQVVAEATLEVVVVSSASSASSLLSSKSVLESSLVESALDAPPWCQKGG